MEQWDNLRIVLAVQRCGSIASAARFLGVNYSTVNRRLAAYEASLGLKLFQSTAKGQICTSLGVRICEAAKRMEEELSSAERSVIGKDERLEGDLRLTMPANFFHLFLAPKIAAFAQTYPEIRLQLGFTSEFSDLSKREADVAFRFSNNVPESLVGVKVFHNAQSIYASPEYLASHEKASERRWIGWNERTRFPDWVRKSSEPKAEVGHQAFNDYAQLLMAAHGMGMAKISCFIGDTDTRVVRVPPAKTLRGRDLWILTHEDLRSTARVKTLITFMRNQLKNSAALFKGEKPQPDAKPQKLQN